MNMVNFFVVRILGVQIICLGIDILDKIVLNAREMVSVQFVMEMVVKLSDSIPHLTCINILYILISSEV